MKRLDQDQLLADLRAEARDAIEDKLQHMTGLAAAPQEDPEILRDLRMDAHSLKGLGAAFGFPAVTIIAHRLEDYLADLQMLDGAGTHDVQFFIDRLHEVCERHFEAGPDLIHQMVRRLPVKAATFDPSEIVAHDVEIMLVSPPGTATRYVRQELGACGYRVTLVGQPLEALNFALHARPDLVVVSAILEGLDGVDLICALSAMPRTRAIPLALLTSLDRDDEKLQDLPNHVPILRKGASFSDDVAVALAKLHII